MQREPITSMLARIAEIRGEPDGWEGTLCSLPGGKEAGEAATSGLIDMKWCLEAALAADGKAAGQP